ncbi:MAG: hypothetical protein ACR5KW_00070 [Wolbachia sp.]
MQIINRYNLERISRNNVNIYLEAYEIVIKEVEQFCYIDLQIYIYKNVLNEKSSTEEKIVFNVLTGRVTLIKCKFNCHKTN